MSRREIMECAECSALLNPDHARCTCGTPLCGWPECDALHAERCRDRHAPFASCSLPENPC